MTTLRSIPSSLAQQLMVKPGNWHSTMDADGASMWVSKTNGEKIRLNSKATLIYQSIDAE